MTKFEINSSLKIKNFDKHQKSIAKSAQEYIKSSDKDLQKLINMSFNSGKNLRSNIILGIVSAMDPEIDNKVISACASIEILHLASLVHDDDLDSALTRRGEPTIYAEAGHENALLLGDYLFACAHQAAADASQEVALIIAKACRDMCFGQFLEQKDSYNANRSTGAYLAAIEGKTSSLTIASSNIGGVFAEGADKKSLEAYGRYFGLAFQQLDDVLDLLSTKEQLGKPVHQDLKQGTYTLPVLHALSSSAGSKLITPYIQVAKNLEYDTDKLVDDLHSVGAFKAAFKEIKNNIAMAQKSTEDSKQLKGLADLPDKYLDWSLKNQIAKQHLDKLG